MSEENYVLQKKVIKYTGNYGGITNESKFWDDLEDLGYETLMKHKITKIKIYSGSYQGKQVILGISYEFKNLFTGKVMTSEIHKSSQDFEDFKEYEIKNNEFLTDFHIRFPHECDYITQLGFTTSKGSKIFLGTEEGENKIILSNGGQNIIIGTFGCLNKKLDAMGCLYISKKEYARRRIFYLFMLRYIIKKDNKFKEQWDNKLNELPEEFKYIWKTINLPDTAFSQIITFCFF